MNTDPPRGIIRRTRSALIRSVLERIARGYVAGESLADARRVAVQWSSKNIPCTLGYWDNADDKPRQTANHYLECIAGMQEDEYISIKLTALDYSEELLSELAEGVARKKVRLHFDAMDPPSAEPTRKAVESFVKRNSGLSVGYTLPGRWKRSEDDARWAAECNLNVRVVKGQFPDDPTYDPAAGYSRVIDVLAGKARHVAVATHDVALGERSLNRLRESDTSCELELLHGLPTRKSLKSARSRADKVRIYIGYGKAHLPYAVQKVMDNPRMIGWLVRDFVRL